MPAEVENMFYSGQVPWHGIGISVPSELNAAEAIVLAGLDWEVETAKIVTNDQKRTAIDDYRVTRRLTDNAILGVVKKNYVPIQNREAFGMFDNVVGEGKAYYHTAGSLRGGSKVWMLAKLPGVIEVGKDFGKSDEVERYLLLSNSHDGSRPLQMIFTPVRVVCSNTLSIALMKENGDEVTKIAPRVSIKQNSKASLRIKEAERTMGSALKYYEKFGDFANFLRSKQVNKEQVTNIVAEVFPPNKKKEVTPTAAYYRTVITTLFDQGRGHERIAGSAWAMLNAFAEFADHAYSIKGAHEAEDRSYSIWMGGAKGLKQRATKSIFEAVS